MMATAQEPPVIVANEEAEAALLGALMLDNRAVDRVADRLLPEHFHEPAHGRIYSAILRECGLGRTANPVTLRPYFEDDDILKPHGGAGYLAMLTGSGAAIIGLRDFADQVVELARRRRLAHELQRLVEESSNYEKPFDEMVAEAETAIHEASGDMADGTVEISAAKAVQLAVEPGEMDPGVRSGIEGLDRVLGPIKPTELVVLAGRPGMGKTACATSYGIGVARGRARPVEEDEPDQKDGVLFISLEMGAQQLGERIAADLCFNGHDGINYADIEGQTLSHEQRRRVIRASFEIEELPFEIVDVGSMTAAKLDSTVRRWKRRFAARGTRLRLVIVDYLQLVRPSRKCKDRYEAVTEVSMALKATAKTHKVGLLALAQLSRDVEKRGGNKRPNLADLRDSGQIEQDADGVCFLFRPDYYLKKEEPAEHDPKYDEWRALYDRVKGELEFIVAKRRGRPEGIGRGRFWGAFQAVR